MSVQQDADIASLLSLSDERDMWLRRTLDDYRRGFNDGRAYACVQLAEMEEWRESIAWFREWSATLQRIIQNDTDPSVHLNRALREIADDQKFMREARIKLADKPWQLTPLEACALRRIRLADPGDNPRTEAA